VKQPTLAELLERADNLAHYNAPLDITDEKTTLKDRQVICLSRAYQHATAELARAEERIRHLYMLEQPWDLLSVVRRLAEFAHSRLTDHGYDGHGWEELHCARTVAFEWLARGESEETKMEAETAEAFGRCILKTPWAAGGGYHECNKLADRDDGLCAAHRDMWACKQCGLVHLYPGGICSPVSKPPPNFTPKPGDRVVLMSSPDPDDTELVGAAGRFAGLKASGAVFFVPSYGRSDHRFIVNRDAVFAPAPAQAEQPSVFDETKLEAVWQGALALLRERGEDPEAIIRHAAENIAACLSRPFVFPDAMPADEPQAEQPPAVASGVAAGEVTDEELTRIALGSPGAARRALYDAGLLKGRMELSQADLRQAYDKGAESVRAASHIALEASQAEVAELKRELQQLDTDSDAIDRSRRATIATLRQELEAEKAAHQRTKELYASAIDCLKKAKEYASPPASPDNTPPDEAKGDPYALYKKYGHLGSAPAACIEAVKAEVAELKLQGLVTRRLLMLAYDRIRELPVYTATLESIEREERERAGKAQ
jgi:hypothetical protein